MLSDDAMKKKFQIIVKIVCVYFFHFNILSADVIHVRCGHSLSTHFDRRRLRHEERLWTFFHRTSGIFSFCVPEYFYQDTEDHIAVIPDRVGFPDFHYEVFFGAVLPVAISE